MKTIYSKIAAAFSKLGIHLNSPLTGSQALRFTESLTNQFLKVEDLRGNTYLVRINGQLWSPFNRKDEDLNLKQLKALKISSKVIFNDFENGFQICKFPDEQSKFTHAKNKNALLYLIGIVIKNYHARANFNNEYRVASTLQSSFARLPVQDQIKLNGIYQLILRMLLSLTNDQTHFVASHNDLLASSVYCEAEQVSIVDWEYSGRNHRSYDLALFSLKASLAPEQEAHLIAAYDPENNLNVRNSILIMKPVVSFLLFIWGLNSNSAELNSQIRLMVLQVQSALVHSSAKMLSREKALTINRTNIRNMGAL